MAPSEWLSLCGLCADVLGVFFLIGAAVWEEIPGEHRRMMWAGLILVASGLALQLWIFLMKR
jgi:hypothetical protein